MKKSLFVILNTALLAPLLASAQFTLPPLPYAPEALEPYVDKLTMEIHHDRHHAAYVSNLNAQIKNFPDLAKLSIEDLQGRISQYNDAVRNNGGGHYNHSLFWLIMSPEGARGEPDTALNKAISEAFGSLEELQKRFSEAGISRFGSGWAWLILTDDKKLAVCSTANQDNPLMDLAGNQRGTPLLCLDVWEHAYYLKYQNKRGDYVANWWKVVNWQEVNRRYSEALKK